jgi:hypothetical protein
MLKTITYKDYLELSHKEQSSFTGVIEPTKFVKSYYKNGLLHREDGPAVIDTQYHIEVWYYNNKRHNLNGPAYIDSKNIKLYFVNGTQTTKEAVELLRDLYRLKNLKL